MTGIKIPEKDVAESRSQIDGGVPNSCYKLEDEVAVSLKKQCVLHICGQRSGQTVALALSDCSLMLYDVCNLRHISTLPAHSGSITDIKFSSMNEQLLYSSSLDGTVKLHDLRSNTCVSELRDDSEGPTMLKPLTSFDFSIDERFASAGTEVVDGDAFVLFWDIRSFKLLGGYWESHTGDVTQVRFHPEEKNTLATGSVDGLINVFNISKPCEDDALTYCLNTESSVDKLHWFPGTKSTFGLSCITHTEELQLWNTDDAAPFSQFSRADVSNILKDDIKNTYLVNTHSQGDSRLLVIAGCAPRHRSVLQAIPLNKDMTSLQPAPDMKGNKQVVRSSWYNIENQFLLTGGEGGLLSLWKPCSSSSSNETVNNIDSQLKSFKIKHKTKAKPYERE